MAQHLRSNRMPVVLALTLAFVAPGPGSPAAQETWEAGPPIDPDTVGTGTLLWKSGRGMIPLPLLQSEVEIEITGLLVRGTLTQRFSNPTGEVIEADYVFPLPERAAVRHMELRIGPRRIVSVVQEKQQARQTYETAKQEGKKAALLEQDRPNLFTVSAANINPGESVEVLLEYLEEVRYLDGEFRLRFPLTFTPRYVPPSMIGPVAGTGTPFIDAVHPAAPRVRLRARIDAGMPLGEVGSRSHELSTFLDGETAWEVEPVGGSVPADRDFRLHWRPLVEARAGASLFVEERDGSRYGLLMLVPPARDAARAGGLPTETLFVIDVSGSMAGPSIQQARAALLAALDRLRPEDRFNILKFSDRTGAFSSGFVPAAEAMLERAREWVRDLEAGGGTEIHSALVRSLDLLGDPPTHGAQRLIFLTDGAVANEDQVFRTIVEKLGDARLHAIGIGAAPNAHLMRKMAEFGRGFFEFIAEPAGNGIDEFLARIDRPVMSEVHLRWEGISVREIYPRRLPDLYPGEPLVVSFKLEDGSSGGRVVLQGTVRDGSAREEFALDTNAPSGSGVATRWARHEVGSLIDALHEGADAGMVREEVVRVGLDFHLVTRYTSLVAVEEFSSAQGDPTAVRAANGLPHGSQLGLVLPQGGTRRPLLTLLALLLVVTGGLLLGAHRWVCLR